MHARIQRWGNSLALRLPKAATERLGVSDGSQVELDETDRGLVIRPVHRYRLRDLLAQVRPQNLHDEVSTGRPRGKEAW